METYLSKQNKIIRDDRDNTVVFIGHNECCGVTSEIVTAEIIKLIEKGAVNFLSGGQGGFDRLCAGRVYHLKKIIHIYKTAL